MNILFKTTLSTILMATVYASSIVTTNFSKNIIDDYCIATDQIECNKITLLEQEVDIDTSVYYIQRDIIKPINGLLQHDISAAVNEMASNPIGPHSQTTVNTFKAITKLPSEFKETNSIELDINNLITYKYGNFKIGLNNSVVLQSSVYLNSQYSRLILQVDLSGVSSGGSGGSTPSMNIAKDTTPVAAPSLGNSYIEYDPYTDSYKLSDETTYKSRSFIYAIYQGIDYLKLKGIKLVEIPMDYRYIYNINDSGNILINPMFSIMNGTTFNKALNFISIGDAVESGDYESLVSDTYMTQYNYRLGLKLLYTYKNFGVKLTANNINRPTFNTKISGENILFDSEYNLATSYLYFDKFISTIAYDLVPTSTQIKDYNMQYIYADTTWLVLEWLSVNLNARYNTTSVDEGSIIGTDITAGWTNFKLNLYANASLNTTKLEVVNINIPDYAKVGLNLIGKW